MTSSKNFLDIQPLTPDRWDDFTGLFGKNGASGGCWCMWWRQTRREFDEKHGESNKRAMHAIVKEGQIPGLLGYLEGEAVGWCSVAPRDQFESLERSPVLKRLDDEPVWSIVCLFVKRGRRGMGASGGLIQGAIDYVRQRGGKFLEAYPTLARGKKLPPVSSYLGVPEMFAAAGFVECAQPSKSKVIMRYAIK